jgi:hypothetical protein
MPLVSSTLSKALEAIFQQKPPSASAAGAMWASAYLSYAASAMSSASSLPVTAAAGLGTLVSAFTGAFQTQDQTSSGAAGQIAQGVISFWSSIVWVGPSAAGSTTSPGNSSLSSELGSIFGDTGDKTAAEKAQKIADAFHSGAKLVIVNDIPFAQPAPPIVGPIS